MLGLHVHNILASQLTPEYLFLSTIVSESLDLPPLLSLLPCDCYRKLSSVDKFSDLLILAIGNFLIKLCMYERPFCICSSPGITPFSMMPTSFYVAAKFMISFSLLSSGITLCICSIIYPWPCIISRFWCL